MNDLHSALELKRGTPLGNWAVASSQFVESPLGPNMPRISGGRCSLVIIMLRVQFEWKGSWIHVVRKGSPLQ